MAEHLGVTRPALATATVPQTLLRVKPDRRQLLLGGNRRSTDANGLRYPYALVYPALLIGHVLLLSLFVAYGT